MQGLRLVGLVVLVDQPGGKCQDDERELAPVHLPQAREAGNNRNAVIDSQRCQCDDDNRSRDEHRSLARRLAVVRVVPIESVHRQCDRRDGENQQDQVTDRTIDLRNNDSSQQHVDQEQYRKENSYFQQLIHDAFQDWWNVVREFIYYITIIVHFNRIQWGYEDHLRPRQP